MPRPFEGLSQVAFKARLLRSAHFLKTASLCSRTFSESGVLGDGLAAIFSLIRANLSATVGFTGGAGVAQGIKPPSLSNLEGFVKPHLHG